MNKKEKILVRRAVKHINYLKRYAFTLPNDEWIEVWNEFELQWSETTTPYVTLPWTRVSQFAELARRDPVVFDLAKFITALRMRAGIEVPAPIHELIVSFLAGELTAPPGKRGRPREWKRNFIILDTLYELEQGRLKEKGRKTIRNRYISLDKKPNNSNRDKAKEKMAEKELAFVEILYSAIQQSEFPIMELKRIQDLVSEEKSHQEFQRVARMRFSVLLDDLDNEHV